MPRAAHAAPPAVFPPVLPAGASIFRATARNAAASPESWHPVPVTRLISSLPPRITTHCCPSETRSIAPVTASTAPRRLETAFTKVTASTSVSSVTTSTGHTSTPPDEPVTFFSASSESFRISDMLPRMAVNVTASNSSSAIFRRNALAPTPTGSSSTGIPFAFAAFPAASIACSLRSLGVPILRASAPACAVISPISCGSSAMTGFAPHARIMFATSCAVT